MTIGVCMSNLAMIVKVSCHGFALKKRYCCFYLDGGQTDLVDECKVVLQDFNRCIFSYDKNLLNPKMTVCTTFKSFKCQSFL